MASEICEDFESAQPGKYFLCQYDVVQNFFRELQEHNLLCSCPMRCVKTRYTALSTLSTISVNQNIQSAGHHLTRLAIAIRPI